MIVQNLHFKLALAGSYAVRATDTEKQQVNTIHTEYKT